jgi:phosphoribosylanthranilate isomerase
MRTQIKICGIQSSELAFATAKAGADYIGLVCAPSSKRFIPPKKIPELVDAIHQGGAQAVLVVKDAEQKYIHELLNAAPFDLIQLHGSCALTLPKHLPRIYALSAETNISLYPKIDAMRDFLIFDHSTPGSGKIFCWKTFIPPFSIRWFLAGGLTPDNVSLGIQTHAPFAVDVSSGVEDNAGNKQLTLITQFINKVNQS